MKKFPKLLVTFGIMQYFYICGTTAKLLFMRLLLDVAAGNSSFSGGLFLPHPIKLETSQSGKVDTTAKACIS